MNLFDQIEKKKKAHERNDSILRIAIEIMVCAIASCIVMACAWVIFIACKIWLIF